MKHLRKGRDFGNWLFVHHFGNYYLVRGVETMRLHGKSLIHKGRKP